MKKYIFFFLLIILAGQSKAQRTIEVVKFDWYENLFNTKNDTTYVINFWATWCMPCVEELPEFEKLNTAYKDKKVKVILVSLDSYKKLTITLIPYIEKMRYQSKVVLLNEPNYNSWIDKVDRHWMGAIPATVIFNKAKQVYHFMESSTTFDELNKLLSNIH